ncbi:hypothetical protein [Anaerobiospirillum sp. NML120449]|uniref:hypothetical protein n=1 Tax=Anaerobiospirillum sp. NML120449 TaxID=2932817 RepID=UPI001FF2D505|nr:hypothetical protein [Anaerobiospirillum sp. NML120449]MCK0527344.1 hypothetical protein [Anaerobiospirillum sp. NML120449]
MQTFIQADIYDHFRKLWRSGGSGPAGDYHYLVSVLPLPEKQDETSGIRPCNVFGQLKRKK